MGLQDTNWELEKGCTFTFPIGLSDGAGNPTNLTGFTFVMQLRQGKTLTSKLYYTLRSDQTNPKITIPTPANGTAVIAIPPEDTLNFEFAQAYYDVLMVSPAGITTKIMKGAITVNQTVTQSPFLVGGVEQVQALDSFTES